MLIVILGGAGSGKSEYAEDILKESCKSKLYIATMKPYGEETLKKIERHKKMRKNKGFETMEIYEGISEIKIEKDYDGIMLECISNTVANEIFGDKSEKPTENIIKAIEKIRKKAKTTIIVTNDIGRENKKYDKETEYYRETLNEINIRLAEMADRVEEIVYSIPIRIKG